MAKTITSNDIRSALVAQGVITLIFGIAVLFWPSITIGILIYLFGAFILVSGILRIFRGLSNIGDDMWWALTVLLGIVELGFGTYILRHPHESFTIFISLIGFILIIRGVVELVIALFDPKKLSTSRGMTIFSGGLAVVVGVVILNQKASAGIAFVWILGVYAISVGIIQLMVARSIDE